MPRDQPTLFNRDRILRYEVPVDGDWHALTIAGPPLHVACRIRGLIELWARTAPHGAAVPKSRMFRAVNTGDPVPCDVTYWGAAVTPTLVWHLVEQAGVVSDVAA